MDSIQSEWIYLVKSATAIELSDWSSEIANMCSHNAYHTGQIVYIRNQKGWWD
ncbi:hypothetical protein [Aurantibacter sp.]|uniref:hypothetical protein n=1 Tax=Aurantibacter sp. TaxID=2807103 RepID=UPI0032640F7A